MAFVPNNFVQVQGYASDSDAQLNIFKYNSLTDTQAAVETVGYFNSIADRLTVNDLMYLVMETGTATGLYYVSVIAAGVVTVAGFATIGAGGVGTAQLADDAVTTAKIIDDAVTTAKILDANVTSAKIAANVIQYAKVAMTAAEFNGMYAAPKLLVAAGGANTLHVVDRVAYEVDYGGAQFAAGGATAVQFDSTANGAGSLASAATAAAVFIAFVADGVVGAAGSLASATAASTVNKGLYLSNLTGAFTTGTSTVDVHLWYATVAVTF